MPPLKLNLDQIGAARTRLAGQREAERVASAEYHREKAKLDAMRRSAPIRARSSRPPRRSPAARRESRPPRQRRAHHCARLPRCQIVCYADATLR